LTRERGIGTKLIHSGEDILVPEKPLEVPIYLSAGFITPSLARIYLYSREANPTVTALEEKIAEIEGHPSAVAFSSGMSAISTIFLTLLKPGSKMVIQRDIFARTIVLAREFSEKIGFKLIESSPEEVINEVERWKPDLVFIESVSNPLLKVIDIYELGKLCREIGSILVVDNTIPTPINLRPSEAGAHIVVHSASKYLGGHNDIIGGVAAGEPELMEEIRDKRSDFGTIMDPFTAFLVIRGLKALHIRMHHHNENAEKLAKALEVNKKISKVYYPGLESHPSYSIAKKILKGFGGIVSIEIKADMEATLKFMKELKIAKPAGTFGGPETLVSHPATMSHRHYSKEEREMLGISDSLVRISVGLENIEDIIEDIEEALSKI
jgi:cystathionine gamma-synthase